MENFGLRVRGAFANLSILSAVWLIGAFQFSGALHAQAQQTGTIMGVVTDARDGNALPGVNVTVEGLNLGAATTVDGAYTIEGVPAGEHSVAARFVGYQAQTRAAQVAAGDTAAVDFALREDVMGLDEVVVTGVAGGEQARSLGHDVGRIEAADVVETAPITNMQDLLGGRVSGVEINQSTGNVGGGGVTRVRGVSSLIANEPLVYVDGIRVNSNPRSGAGEVDNGLSLRETQTVSRMNDFNPEDIANAEII